MYGLKEKEYNGKSLEWFKKGTTELDLNFRMVTLDRGQWKILGKHGAYSMTMNPGEVWILARKAFGGQSLGACVYSVALGQGSISNEKG